MYEHVRKNNYCLCHKVMDHKILKFKNMQQELMKCLKLLKTKYLKILIFC